MQEMRGRRRRATGGGGGRRQRWRRLLTRQIPLIFFPVPNAYPVRAMPKRSKVRITATTQNGTFVLFTAKQIQDGKKRYKTYQDAQLKKQRMKDALEATKNQRQEYARHARTLMKGTNAAAQKYMNEVGHKFWDSQHALMASFDRK
jgi:hypothetical protein